MILFDRSLFLNTLALALLLHIMVFSSHHLPYPFSFDTPITQLARILFSCIAILEYHQEIHHM